MAMDPVRLYVSFLSVYHLHLAFLLHVTRDQQSESNIRLHHMCVRYKLRQCLGHFRRY